MPANDPGDVLAVMQVLNRYAWAIDTGEIDGLREVFTDDVVADYGGFVAHGADDLVARMIVAHAHLRATQHVISGHDVTVEGDHARSRCQVVATLRRSGRPPGVGPYRMGGWYEDELVRTAAGWRVRVRRARGFWQEGDLDAVVVPDDATTATPADGVSPAHP